MYLQSFAWPGRWSVRTAFSLVARETVTLLVVFRKSDEPRINCIALCVVFARCEPYVKSKTLAEMAAWDLLKDEKSEGSLELAVVNPSLVIGPSLTKNTGTSIDICTQILNRKMMATPHLCLNVVDVRDVAEGIVRSMVSGTFDLRMGCTVRLTGETWFSKHVACAVVCLNCAPPYRRCDEERRTIPFQTFCLDARLNHPTTECNRWSVACRRNPRPAASASSSLAPPFG